jgi:hypothetical protein
VRRGGLWAKHMGLKCIRNTLGEHIGDILEPIGNKRKMKKILPPKKNLK